MLQVVADSVADKDHLLLELAVVVVFGDDLPEECEELREASGSSGQCRASIGSSKHTHLFQPLVLGRKDELDDAHEGA